MVSSTTVSGMVVLDDCGVGAISFSTHIVQAEQFHPRRYTGFFLGHFL